MPPYLTSGSACTLQQTGANLGPKVRRSLAACDGAPTWTRSGESESALLIPAELGAREALRERLCDGRNAALLPLLHFLRARTETIRWQPPAARASLLFDDPNLHWPSYGFVKLARARAPTPASTVTTSPWRRCRSTPGSPTPPPCGR